MEHSKAPFNLLLFSLAQFPSRVAAIVHSIHELFANHLTIDPASNLILTQREPQGIPGGYNSPQRHLAWPSGCPQQTILVIQITELLP